MACRPAAVEDGGAAVRLVRERAREWRVDPGRVGMLGFSAGGFVTAATTLDAETAARPSFLAPIYPAMWGGIRVPSPAPPMFLAWASDDEVGDAIIGASLRLHDAWRRAGASVEGTRLRYGRPRLRHDPRQHRLGPVVRRLLRLAGRLGLLAGGGHRE